MKVKAVDVCVAAGAVVAVFAAYAMGWIIIDVTGWITLSEWQARPEHIGGVRFFAGACLLGLGGIGLSLAANR